MDHSQWPGQEVRSCFDTSSLDQKPFLGRRDQPQGCGAEPQGFPFDRGRSGQLRLHRQRSLRQRQDQEALCPRLQEGRELPPDLDRSLPTAIPKRGERQPAGPVGGTNRVAPRTHSNLVRRRTLKTDYLARPTDKGITREMHACMLSSLAHAIL